MPQHRRNHHHSSPSRRQPRPLPRHERYVYTYRLLANNTPIQFMISVEPESGKPKPGKYTFRLSFKANGIERKLCEPESRKLKVDPRHLDFVVFIFPGKSSLPAGCLWSLRVWLRVNNVDHRIWGDDDLWIAKDPDFNSIGDASFARLKNADTGEQIYNAYVGRALVTFIVRWRHVSNKLYSYSLEYEAAGVGDMLFDDYKLRLDGDPRALSFLIFSIPSNSIPSGASHKLRVWIRSLVPLSTSDPTTSYVLPFNDSYIYQRLWKDDGFKIGGRLDFESLGTKMIMGFSSGAPETIVMPHPPPSSDLHSPRSIFNEKNGYDF
ncbi:hypothetical protein NLJ89_g889 [Agrocybe chaxingu]|uniref:Uncharacterized protein n=1 Tax=Agrocybe chaxingu TaxID=84603 RepID=A0A9W8N142_9AGAR|nr:hypothetical protein NLJ89_g889 [Agrocybe chaxingu]